MVSLLGLNRRRADALLSYTADLNAEMLVVGGYGHSRLGADVPSI
jgi:nucleotide-binding universal stress UspA family protein